MDNTSEAATPSDGHIGVLYYPAGRLVVELPTGERMSAATIALQAADAVLKNGGIMCLPEGFRYETHPFPTKIVCDSQKEARYQALEELAAQAQELGMGY